MGFVIQYIENIGMASEWKVENSSKCIAPGLIQCLRTVISEIPEFGAIKTTTIRFKQSHFRHTIKLTKHTNDVVYTSNKLLILHQMPMMMKLTKCTTIAHGAALGSQWPYIRSSANFVIIIVKKNW